MKRDITKKLKQWKERVHRKPLLIQGARRVGKTFVIKEFGKQFYDNTVYVNFEQTPAIKEYFLISLEPNHIIKCLNIAKQSVIVPGKTLIILDEIQECGKALTSLKYFCEEAPEYHVIAVGSLLGVTHDGGFPVGKVEFLHMYPLTFYEFLSAINEERLRDYLENIENLNGNIPLHTKLLHLLKSYLFVGGMPEALFSYSQKEDFTAVRDIQKAILIAYENDFSKHVPTYDIPKVNTLWRYIPHYLSKKRKKCSFADIKKSARLRDYERALNWLQQTKLVHLSYAINRPEWPLKHYAQENDFKMFLLDVGLLGALSDLDASTVIDGNKLFSQFKGAITDNYIAQELVACDEDALFYWKSKNSVYEIDFLLPKKNEIYPLEVKAERTRDTKSLHKYIRTYSPSKAIITSSDQANFSNNICHMPLYLLANWHKLLG